MTIQIEKGVPLPAPREGSKYPFKDMEVNDSFVVRLSETRATSIISLQSAISNCAKSAIGPRKIATRKLPDGSGLRVWRIAA